MRARRLSSTLWSALAIVIALMWAFPVYWMVNSSLLSNVRLQSTTPAFLPIGGSLDNFRKVLSDPGFGRALAVSLAVACAAPSQPPLPPHHTVTEIWC